MSELNVKAGDKVICSRWFHDDVILTVKKVTPSGIIRTHDGISFNKYGTETPYNEWGNGSIRKATEEDVARFEQSAYIRELINYLNKLTSSGITYEQAVEINKILGRESK